MYLESRVGSPGYVIPYYSITGERAPFYRLRLFNPLPGKPKYSQPGGTGNYVYFPRTFPDLIRKSESGQALSCINGFEPALFIVEGEKKAAKAASEGFLCCGLGGVYNWRTKVIELTEDVQVIKSNTGTTQIRLKGPGNLTMASDGRALLAAGMLEMILMAKERGMQIVICFDTDYPTNVQVQIAAAELAFELRNRGIPSNHIRQLVLPSQGDKKVALDDYLCTAGPDALKVLLHGCLERRSAFPRHPDIKAFINKRMQGPMLRSEAKELALSIVADMDADGIRMIDRAAGIPYFFDGRSKSLMKVNLLHTHNEPLHEGRFGEFLYHQYDISQSDQKLLYWLAAGFTGEQPVEDVSPRSVVALLPNNRIALQVDDGHFAIVSGDAQLPFRIVENGTEGLLFRADQVEAIDHTVLRSAFNKELQRLKGKSIPFSQMHWPFALGQFKFCRETDWQVLSVLCYMSPWLLRWNGTQLPVELMIGEPGSGKSSMYTLRQHVLTGRPALRNQPTDIRDWYASITTNDGMHVTDNLHFASKELRQRLSDEICRIVTEPTPYVEMRKLFTTSENTRIPVRTTFAITAIQQPFMNADILQRSLIVELQAVGTNHAADWAGQQLEAFGGRIGWVAHQLAVLHLFFDRANKEWQPNYRSHHRLANFEQVFTLMAKVVGMEQPEEVVRNLVNVAETQVSEYDWTMEALKDFSAHHLPELQRDPRKGFTTEDVASWAAGEDSYSENAIITNARRLSRYFKSHMTMIETCTGIYKMDTRKANRDWYRIRGPKNK
jgi:hypothetical protein